MIYIPKYPFGFVHYIYLNIQSLIDSKKLKKKFNTIFIKISNKSLE
jgi:hypothetical protein